MKNLIGWPCLLSLCCLSGIKTNPATHVNHRQTRGIRMPGFSGLSDLSDNVKVPNVDLASQFKKLLAAEALAREKLQATFSQLADRVKQTVTAVNPDEKNKWVDSEDKCGEILIGQSGFISYKLKRRYENNELCVWTVRANYRSKIKVQLTQSNIKDDADHVSVLELDAVENSTESMKATKLREGVRYIFNGPVLFVVFYTDASKVRGGFHLDYEGVGMPIPYPPMYQHLDLNAGKVLNLPSTNNEKQYTTAVIKSENPWRFQNLRCGSNDFHMHYNFFSQDWVTSESCETLQKNQEKSFDQPLVIVTYTEMEPSESDRTAIYPISRVVDENGECCSETESAIYAYEYAY